MSVSATTNGIRPGVCLSTARPASPFIGQVIYMSDTNETAAWTGSEWVGLDRSKDRNVIINGAMQIAQRGTSTASITTSGYYTADRYAVSASSLGTWTQSVENDAPTGSGLRKSLKMLCTTADASPAAADLFRIDQYVEGQNSQQFLKGTASAKPFTLSFWVKSNVTGTYIAALVDGDNTRTVSATYTVSASATWEKKTITFPADTTGAFDNDNGASLQMRFWLGAGSDRTSGTLNTTWAALVTANLAVGQTNLASATNNYWQITGVQLEAGSVATPFEFEDIGTTLAKCFRYFNRVVDFSSGGSNGHQNFMVAHAFASTNSYGVLFYPLMRGNPTVTFSGNTDFFAAGAGGNNIATTAMAASDIKPNSCRIQTTVASGLTAGNASFTYTASTAGKIDMSAEL